jgi:predicted TIM-barrel fold metal-dependent hydrolase
MLIKKNALAAARKAHCVSRRLGVFIQGGIPVSRLSTLSRPLPAGTWCSHMHIVDNRFPFAPTAQYAPHPHTVADARTFFEPLGIKNYVIVQPSIYANDNSCTIDALRAFGPRHGRAVVQFDPKAGVVQRVLDEWHELGVRGVRVNLVSVGRVLGEQELRSELMAYADVIRRLDWVLEVYIPLTMVTILERIVPELCVKVCIDHFGQPTLPTPSDSSKAVKPYDLPGFVSLINLLQGDTWVKMSGQYRISKDPEMRDLEPIAMELLKMAPDRVVYATDYPHTRFEDIDSVPFIEACFRWCGEDTGLAEKLFVKNAEELWDVPPSTES